MYYIAILQKKKRFFQKAYIIKDNKIYITNTKRAKAKFLKSDIKNVVFFEEFKKDPIIGPKLVIIQDYDGKFLQSFLEGMILCLAEFFKLTLPVGEIAICSEFSEGMLKKVLPYAKMVTIVGEDGKSNIIKGVNVRRIKKLKSPPDIIITDRKNKFSSIFKVPVIDLGENERADNTLSYKTISFKTDLFPFEINAPQLIDFLKEHPNITYSVTSYRKKCPLLFTLG